MIMVDDDEELTMFEYELDALMMVVVATFVELLSLGCDVFTCSCAAKPRTKKTPVTATTISKHINRTVNSTSIPFSRSLFLLYCPEDTVIQFKIVSSFDLSELELSYR